MDRHDIHIEHDPGTEDLLGLAELDEDAPLSVPALVSSVDGEAVAALSLVDGRVVAHPFRPTATIVTMLRLQAGEMHASREPSLRERILGPLRRRRLTPAPI